MTTPTPAEQLQTTYNSLTTDLRSLQEKVHLSDAREALLDLDTKIRGLPQVVQNLRSRQYAFVAGLEGQAEELSRRMNGVRPSVDLFIEQQAAYLETAIRPLEARLTYLSGQLNNPDYSLGVAKEIEVEKNNLEGKVSGAVNTASGMYSQVSEEFYILNHQIDALTYTLDQIDQASFKLLPTEAVIMAIKATWTRDNREDKDDPQGILFLTDQRLIFEQKQEIATKKVLFITTERKLVQQLQLEVPVAMITDVKGIKQGMFKNEDYLELIFATGAPVKNTMFHIFGEDFTAWVGLINRARTHDFDKDRALQMDQAAAEKVKNAPTVCPSCSGTLPTVILRGQDTIVCEYCGATIRL